jgi:RNA recognition motif-containing protein
LGVKEANEDRRVNFQVNLAFIIFIHYSILVQMNLFVAKLNFKTREEDLRDLFEEYGEVESVKIVMDKMTGKSKGFGFVEMPDTDAARTAIRELNDTEFDGRTIVVKEAEPREKRSNSNWGGGGGRRY